MLSFLNKIKRKEIWICGIITFIVMAAWNYTTPLYGDDELMTHMSIIQIIKAGIHDYFNWNGRFVGQTIFRILVNIPLALESILNSFVFVLFTVLIFLIAKKDSIEHTLFNYAFVLIITVGLFCRFAEMYIWRAGVGNYLWPIVLDLILIYLVKYDIKFDNGLKNYVYIFFLSIYCLIVGETNENVVGGVFIILIFYIVWNKLNFKKYLLPLFCMIIGYVILIESPGEWKRAAMTNPGFSKLSIIEKIETNMHGFLGGLFYFDKYIIFLVCFLFIMNWFYVKDKKIIIESAVWIIAGSLQILVLLLSPGGAVEDRTHFGAFVFMCIACMKLFNIPEVSKKIKNVYVILFYILGIFVLCSFIYGSIDSYNSNVALNKRNDYILKERKLGKNVIYVNPLLHYGKSKYSITYQGVELENNPNFWVNKAVEHNVGVKKVILINK